MEKLFTSQKIFVMPSKIPNSGRGVYAKVDIKKDELIERCPIIEISEGDTAKLNESILTTYFFYHGKNKNQALVALGFGSIYNHSYKPNATHTIKGKERIMEFTALNDIKIGEEITINYNSERPKNKNPLWFEGKKS